VYRRDFIAAAPVCGLPGALAAGSPALVIDTHIHLFDPARPQGVPWPEKTNAVLYQPALPPRYRKITAGLGIVGAIEIECSPWPEDNQWVLDIAARDNLIVGTIGNLEPAQSGFRPALERLHRNPLFRGIRYGNLWGRNLGAELSQPEFVAGLRMLAEAGLVLDTANPTAALVADVVRLTDLVPSLRIVMDHLPQLDPSAADLPRLASCPNVYVKISGVLRRENGRVPLDLEFYRARLERLWQLFGEDRLLYGSDWPNSDQWGTYSQVFNLVREYFRSKSSAAREKYFWRNSIAVYRWIARNPEQRALHA
jgi:predicted TIM-barrel fold metal-dependent hydrolase